MNSIGCVFVRSFATLQIFFFFHPQGKILQNCRSASICRQINKKKHFHDGPYTSFSLAKLQWYNYENYFYSSCCEITLTTFAFTALYHIYAWFGRIPKKMGCKPGLEKGENGPYNWQRVFSILNTVYRQCYGSVFIVLCRQKKTMKWSQKWLSFPFWQIKTVF